MGNINQEQIDFLKALDDEEIGIFTFSDTERKTGKLWHPSASLKSSLQF